MPGLPVTPFATVKLSGAGAGQCSLPPPSGVMWRVDLATVSILVPVLIPQGFVYLGNSSGPLQLVDSTTFGSSASTAKIKGTQLYPGQYVWAVWSGGDAGATATLQLFATAVARYRSAAR
jgi:hypothetical protein